MPISCRGQPLIWVLSAIVSAWGLWVQSATSLNSAWWSLIDFMDEVLAVDSLKASSVKDSSSSFFCHHLLPLPPLLFFSPLLFSHSLSGKTTFEGTILYRAAPGKTEGHRRYYSEWPQQQEMIVKIRSGNWWFLMQLPYPELLALMPRVFVNFWSKDMDLFCPR